MKNFNKQQFLTLTFAISVGFFIAVYPGMPGPKDVMTLLGASFGAMILALPVAFLVTFFQSRKQK